MFTTGYTDVADDVVCYYEMFRVDYGFSEDVCGDAFCVRERRLGWGV